MCAHLGRVTGRVGRAGALRRPELRALFLVRTWPAGWDSEQQPSREASAGALALGGFAQAVDVRGRTCVLRNDAAAAIAAAIASFRKGSTQSPQMQRCALEVDRAAAGADVDLMLLHVPGLNLVAEGSDGASRAGADFGPATGRQKSPEDFSRSRGFR